MLKKILAFVISLSVVVALGVITAFAEDTVLPSEFYDALDELPSDVADRLPDGIYSEEEQQVSDAVGKLVSAEYLFSFISELFELEIGASISLLGRLCGLLLISSIFAVLKCSISSSSLASAFGFCSSCALLGAIVGTLNSQIDAVILFFERINSLMVGFVPIACGVWAMGGNVGTAVSAGGTLYAFLAISEVLCAKGILPVVSLCTVFAICRAISPSLRLEGFSSAIRKSYTFCLGFMMTVLLAVLSSQSLLSASADTIAARSAKMITATVIPVVGGAVSDTLRTVGAGIQYIKSVVGISAIVFILILLLPTLISLIVTRLVYLIAGSVADLLGCESERSLLSELGSISGLMIAAVSMCSVMFILGFNIFIKSVVAVG